MLTMITELLVDALSSLPTITKLCVSNYHTQQLKPEPKVLLNLAHIYCPRVSYGNLGDLLRSRADVELPIGTVHLDRAGLEEVGGLLSEGIKYVKYHRDPGAELDYDESDLGNNDSYAEDEYILGSSDDGGLMTDEIPGSPDGDNSSANASELDEMSANN
ncbi:hypothetical protein FRC11_003028 [Ceratobasidium sp. 423]|nr:hypothetical protein FRC11_003028 [Ceratobasidium sp. 423]